MSQIVTTFDPSAAASGQFNAQFPNSQGRMIVYNESNISIQLIWPGMKTYCPAWTAMLYCVGAPNATIDWSQLATLNAQNPPLSVVIVEALAESDPVMGTYPAPLVRQAITGNAAGVQSTFSGNSTRAVNNSVVSLGGQTGKTTYLKSFTVTGDKAASPSTGELHITGLTSPLFGDYDLWYFLNQNTGGTTILHDQFDPPLQSDLGGAIVFTFPNLAAGMDLVAQVALQ